METKHNPSGVGELLSRLDQAVRLRDVNSITDRVKDELTRARQLGQLLPASFRQPGNGAYARRLLHRDPDLGYTVVVMTWGPGQQTQLHDHAGIWCVECVVEGQLNVIQYELVEQQEDRCRFVQSSRVEARVGDAGCLIPPFEYHVLENALPDRTSMTVHVYGGEMDQCNLYVPAPEGWYVRNAKRLAYDH